MNTTDDFGIVSRHADLRTRYGERRSHGKFVARLRSKANMTLETIEKARAYIATNPPSKRAAA